MSRLGPADEVSQEDGIQEQLVGTVPHAPEVGVVGEQDHLAPTDATDH